MNLTKDDTELVLGSKIVYRRWEADSHGRLWGAHGGMWKPGVNIAECDRERSHILYTKDRGYTTPFSGCSCGFYGYFTPGESGYQYSYPLSGVAEFTGEVVEGTNGARGQKAEIKALVVKHHTGIIEWNNIIARKIDKSSFDATITIAATVIAALALICLPPSIIEGPHFLIPIFAIIGLVLGFIGVAGFRAIEGVPNAKNYNKIRKAYPQVDIFKTERAMLRKYPQVKPPVLTPDSDEFWKLPKS